MMWLNQSVATINAMLQLLDIYRQIVINIPLQPIFKQNQGLDKNTINMVQKYLDDLKITKGTVTQSAV